MTKKRAVVAALVGAFTIACVILLQKQDASVSAAMKAKPTATQNLVSSAAEGLVVDKNSHSTQRTKSEASPIESPFETVKVALFSNTATGRAARAVFYHLDSMEENAQDKIDALLARLKKNPDESVAELAAALGRLPKDSINQDAKRKLTFMLGELNSTKALPVLRALVEETNSAIMPKTKSNAAVADQLMALNAIYRASLDAPTEGQQIFLDVLQRKDAFPITSRKDAIWYYMELAQNRSDAESTLRKYLSAGEYPLMSRRFTSMDEVQQKLADAETIRSSQETQAPRHRVNEH